MEDDDCVILSDDDDKSSSTDESDQKKELSEDNGTGNGDNKETLSDHDDEDSDNEIGNVKKVIKYEEEEEEDDDTHFTTCTVCKNGGELLCCDSCPLVYHTYCLNPPIKIPKGNWYCPRCSCEPINGKIRQILTWRWAEEETEAYRKKFFSTPLERRKLMPKPRRLYFVVFKDKNYWQCAWVKPEQVDAAEPLYMRHLYRCRWHKYDDADEEPADCDYEVTFDDEFDEDDKGSCKSGSSGNSSKKNSLYERFYKYGVKPAWLQIQKIFNHRAASRGRVEYYCKWRDLPYDLATWETEETCSDPMLLPEFKRQIEIYNEFRNIFLSTNYGVKDGGFVYKHISPPPSKPTTIVRKRKYRYDEKKLPFVKDDNLILYDYQVDGLNFLRHSWATHVDTILADEMGLGKTIQAILFMYSLYKEGHSNGPFLVTAPLSTVVNWEREFEIWAPDFYVVTYSGLKESRQVLREFDLTYDKKAAKALGVASGRKLKGAVKFHVLLTSYEYVWHDSTCLQSIDWKMVVVDEGHRLKTGSSRFFTVLQSYKTMYKLILTGTPLQNNLEELYYLLNFLCPQKFNDLDSFLDEFAEVTKEAQVKKLHDMLGRHMLRRVKADVLKNLPKKSELLVRVELSPMQKKYYRAILERNFDALNSKAGGRQTTLMMIMMDLKKICNHPYLFSSACMTAPVTNEGTSDERYELDSLTKASGKLELLSQMLRKLKDQGHRVLLFSQMTRMMDILEDFMVGEGFTFERIDGSIRGSDRQEAIDRFNAEGSKSFVFLLSTKAGGLGINLATADTIIIYDSDWNPHNDLQALSRAHRIGQKNKVMVYRFVTRKSIEERIMQVAKKKLMLNQLVVETNRGTNKDKISFTKQELETIVRWGAEDLFKDETENAAILYTEKMIDDILDRNKEAVVEHPQKDAFDDLLGSFKVATYDTTNDGEDVEEKENEEKVKEKVENLDPGYWEKLFRKDPDYAKNVQEKHDTWMEESNLGRGKRKTKYRGSYYANLPVDSSSTPVPAKKPKVVKPKQVYHTPTAYRGMTIIPSLIKQPNPKYPNYMVPLNIPIPMGWHNKDDGTNKVVRSSPSSSLSSSTSTLSTSLHHADSDSDT